MRYSRGPLFRFIDRQNIASSRGLKIYLTDRELILDHHLIWRVNDWLRLIVVDDGDIAETIILIRTHHRPQSQTDLRLLHQRYRFQSRRLHESGLPMLRCNDVAMYFCCDCCWSRWWASEEIGWYFFIKIFSNDSNGVWWCKSASISLEMLCNRKAWRAPRIWFSLEIWFLRCRAWNHNSSNSIFVYHCKIQEEW